MRRFIKQIRNSEFLSHSNKLLSFFKGMIIIFAKVFTFGRGIKKQIGNDFQKYKFDYNFIFANYSDWGGKHNEGFSKLLEYSKGCKTVFDIGAHIGLCALPLSRVVNKDGTIFAFEPSDANSRYIRKNIALNKINNIKVITNLVGEKSGVTIPFYESANATGMNSLASYKIDDSYKIVHKEQISIDDFCAEKNVLPEVIKIDVEGAEINVLKGMRKTVALCNPKIILSVHPRQLELLGQSLDELLSVIEELGYKIFSVSGGPATRLIFSEYLLLRNKDL